MSRWSDAFEAAKRTALGEAVVSAESAVSGKEGIERPLPEPALKIRDRSPAGPPSVKHVSAAPSHPDDPDRLVLSDHAKALLRAIFAAWPGATINPVPIAWAPPPNLPGSRQPSWTEGADAPVVGDHCGCCGGRRWWTERHDSRGWRCAMCHPPRPLDAVRVVETR